MCAWPSQGCNANLELDLDRCIDQQDGCRLGQLDMLAISGGDLPPCTALQEVLTFPLHPPCGRSLWLHHCQTTWAATHGMQHSCLQLMVCDGVACHASTAGHLHCSNAKQHPLAMVLTGLGGGCPYAKSA